MNNVESTHQGVMRDSCVHRQTRRELIGWAAGGITLLGGGFIADAAFGAKPTDAMTIGPFYPMLRPLDEDADLTVVNGVATHAKGQIVDLSGRVLKADGTPAAGARVEIWQANAAGRYAHPADMSQVPLDPGFQGFGVQLTDADGRYRFRTVKPGAYRIPDGRVRTPHVHFDVQGRSSRIISQMFVPGEALNATDFLLKAADAPDTLIARKLQPPPGMPDVLAIEWDIVLVSG